MASGLDAQEKPDTPDRSDESDTVDTAGRAGQSLAAVWVLAAATLALHAFTANGYGIFRDELYYIACSEHLALGYVDHPPLSITLLAAWRAMFGDSLFSLRFLPGVAHGAVVVLFGMIARELGAGRYGQALAALTAAILPVYLGTSSFYSMNGFDTFIWAACIYVLCRIVVTGDARLWLLFGAIAGLGLQNKFSVGFLGMALVVGLLLTPQRKQFLSPYLYAGGAIALALFLPHVYWLYTHDWITFEFMKNASERKNAPTNPIKYFADQLLMAHPLMLPIWIGGTAYGLSAKAMRPFRALPVMFVALFFFFSLTKGKAYYLAPAYALVMPIGALAFERVCGKRTWLRNAAFGFLVVGGFAIAPLAVPILPVGALLKYQGALGIGNVKQEVGHDAALDQHFADRFGWKELADEVARVYGQLPKEERGKCAILCSNYGEAGAIDFYGRALGLPKAIAMHNTYWLWGPRDATPDIIVAVGNMGGRMQKAGLFESGGEVARAIHPHAEQAEIPIYVFRKLKPPVTIEQLWSKNKTMI